ncbi:hypothetical protein [Shewanella oncorhynchi]|uniref:hypothetical protein n=1 Tax=Shewanella oncorhynchi TaxID=2726434 RepID=UPI003D7934CD
MENSKFIKISRAYLDLTQVELANLLGLSGNSIARMERDELVIRPVVVLAIQYLLLSNLGVRLSPSDTL